MPNEQVIIDGLLKLDTSPAERQAKDAGERIRKAFSRPLPLGRIGSDITEIDKSLAAANARVIAFGASASVIAGMATAFRSLVTEAIKVPKALVPFMFGKTVIKHYF